VHIFISYASDYKDEAEDLCFRLRALKHEVFFDKSSLPAGKSFDDRIRQAIDAADIFIFLITPESVRKGQYTRTELLRAERKWPTPDWHMLPVMLRPTPLDDIPPSLKSVTIKHRVGNLTAEVVMEVEDRVHAHGASAEAHPGDAPKTGSEGGYRSLALRFSGDEHAGFAVHMTPDGANADPSVIALQPAQLAQALWAHAAPIAGAARRGATAGTLSHLPSGADARKIGQALYEALFDATRGEHLRQQLRQLDPQRGDGLRFVIDTTDAPALARLPWEFIYSPRDDDFLFADRLKPIVRWLDVDAPPPSLAVAPPLRLLMAVATPADRPELSVGTELAHLDSALGELASAGLLETIRLEHTSLERLDAALLEHQPHVLHFIGHGDFIGDDGVLLLESDHQPNRAEAIAGRQLAMLLRNYRAHLRLVFLNSCMGATSAQGDPFGGVAQSLIRRGIPAVIAMQFPIPDEAAVALSRHFYRYLAAGQPVDAALSSARAFLYARGYPVEWGAPALHMRAPDGRLFDLSSPATGGADTAIPDSAPTAANPPSAAPARSTSRLWLVGGLLVGLIGLSVAGWLMFAGDRPDEPPPHVEPAPIVEPPPPVVEPPITAPPPTPDAAIDAVIADLGGGNLDRARSSLSAMLDSGDTTMLEPLHTRRRNDLLDALDSAAAKAQAAGQMDDAAALQDLFARLLPDQAMAAPPPATEDDRFDRETAALQAGYVDQALENLERMPDQRIEVWRTSVDESGKSALIGQLIVAGTNAHAQGNDVQAQRIVEQLQRLSPGIDWQAVVAPDAGAAPAAGYAEPDPLYRVHKGDTLWGLARRFLGSGAAWPQLMQRHNSKVQIGLGGDFIHDADRLSIGQRLHLPTTIDASGRELFTYRVAPGDTLSGIAWRVYGDAALWPTLARGNAATISHPDRLFVGQVLTLPPIGHHY